jgi:hypothetical protein
MRYSRSPVGESERLAEAFMAFARRPDVSRLSPL